jgi:hypothetical protein
MHMVITWIQRLVVDTILKFMANSDGVQRRDALYPGGTVCMLCDPAVFPADKT